MFKLKKAKVITSIIALALTASLFTSTVFAKDYTATIVQGNTEDVGDCKAFFEGLKSVPSGNNYYIWNRGWHYNNGNSYHNYSKWNKSTNTAPDSDHALASAQDLIDAGQRDVLYWSGHGSSNPIRLNVSASSGVYGPGTSKQPVINIPSTMKVNTSNWKNTCVWNKNSKITVAIFGACKILDNDYGDCKYLVRIMKASNLKAIAGFHLKSPAHPIDTAIVQKFFSNSQNGGVVKGESIRSSWQMANELNSRSANWAVLCYKSNYNQYYRIPGFPGKTYSAPASSAPVYRFWCNYTSPTGGQEMATGINTTSIAESKDLPIELYISNKTISENTLTRSNKNTNSDVTYYKELNDEISSDLNETNQNKIATQYLNKVLSTNITDNSIRTVGTITCEEVNEDSSSVPGSEVVVGKTFCYTNQYNDIKMVDNFYKVGTDVDGVYFSINKWKNIMSVSSKDTNSAKILSMNEVKARLATSESVNSKSIAIQEFDEYELVYAPISATTYKLCYEINTEDATYYIDCVSGERINYYVG